MKVIAAITCLVALCSLTSASYYDGCQRAYDQCAFRFEHDDNRVPTYSLGYKPDVAFTPRIISKSAKEYLGILNSNHITPEFINSNGYSTPITYEGEPHFTPTHFKPYTIAYKWYSGVGHQTFHGNQEKVASGRCIRVFFSSYQLLKGKYSNTVVENVNDVKRYEYKCVVFRTL